jgi:hypothetical protein
MRLPRALPMNPDYDFISGVIEEASRKRATDSAYSLTTAERVADDIWAALGIIGNGSFQYFFECGLNAEVCAEAYEAIGLPEGARLFRLALSLFPNSAPHADDAERLAFTQTHEEAFDALAMELIRLDKQMMALLATYLRGAGYHEHAKA